MPAPQTPTPRRLAAVRLVEWKRRRHPELRERRIALRSLLAVAKREGITVGRIDHGNGFAFSLLGGSVIMIGRRLSPAARLIVLAHELGHCWCHVRHVWKRPRLAAEIAESEADHIASLLLRRTVRTSTLDQEGQNARITEEA